MTSATADALRTINADPFDPADNPGGLDGEGGMAENLPKGFGLMADACDEVADASERAIGAADASVAALASIADFAATMGRVIGVRVITAGSGYTSAPTLTIGAPDQAGGAQATGTVVVSGGLVVGVLLTAQGAGYTKAPTLTLTGGGGAGAALEAIVSGVTGIGTKPLDLPRNLDLPPVPPPVWAVEKAANWTLTPDDRGRVFFVTAASVTVTLPGAADEGMDAGWWCRIVAKGGTTTVQRAGSDTIDGGTSISVTASASIHCLSTTTFRSA